MATITRAPTRTARKLGRQVWPVLAVGLIRRAAGPSVTVTLVALGPAIAMSCRRTCRRHLWTPVASGWLMAANALYRDKSGVRSFEMARAQSRARLGGER